MILGPFGPGIADDTGKPLHCGKVGPIRRGTITRVKAISNWANANYQTTSDGGASAHAYLVRSLTLSRHWRCPALYGTPFGSDLDRGKQDTQRTSTWCPS